MNNATSNGSQVMSDHYVKKTKRKSHVNRDCKLMIFGHWETKHDYGSEVPDVSECTLIFIKRVQIVRNLIDIQNSSSIL